MKRAKWFFLFFSLGLLPLSTWACTCAYHGIQQLYDSATVIALVNVRGNVDGRQIEVLRSWKMKLPGRIDVFGQTDGSCGYGVEAGGVYLLYLGSKRQGMFWLHYCAGNLHESNPEFRSHIDWLDDFGIAVEND
jgi:hypothetical protein